MTRRPSENGRRTNEPEREKSVPAERISQEAEREANATYSFSVKGLRFLESETAQNLTALLVAILLIVMSFN
jgi:hypothetical protein